MPELPEVETLKRVLDQQIKGLSIKNVIIHNPQVIEYPKSEVFSGRLAGKEIVDIFRRGKYVILNLSDGQKLIWHLRMTGCILIMPPDEPLEKHTHLIFILNSGMEMRFSDIRRFGRFWLIDKVEEDTYSGIQKLGIEPFDPALNTEYLIKAFGKRKKTIKECLLEQGSVCGIGNIYSDEILFAAGIHPERSAVSLTIEEWDRLAREIPEQLSYFIEKNIVTPEEYLLLRGKEYRNTPFLRVYGHGGEPCQICGTVLEKKVIGGRSSVFCRNCQK